MNVCNHPVTPCKDDNLSMWKRKILRLRRRTLVKTAPAKDVRRLRRVYQNGKHPNKVDIPNFDAPYMKRLTI